MTNRQFSNRSRILAVLLGVALFATPAHLIAQRERGGRGGGQGAATPPGPPIPELPTISYDGKITDLSKDAIVVQVKDGRLFNIKRTGSTKFYKDSKEVKATDLQTGDPVSIAAREDIHGFLIATKVTYREGPIEPEASPAPASSSESSVDVDQPVMIRGGSSSSPGADHSGAPADEPVLVRASSSSPPGADHPGEPAVAATTPPTLAPAPARADRDGLGPDSDAGPAADDPLIDKAREVAFSFSGTLPNFRCDEDIARFAREPRGLGWRPLDVVSSDVVYEDGQESYRNLRVNGQPTDKPMDQLSGSWSTGEFATTLANLFHPDTAAVFRFGEETTLLGLPARVYDFEVKKENSHWNVSSGDRTVVPAYKGSVWIEPKSGRVLRIEIQATGLPSDFPLDQVESSVQYAFVPIGANSVLLPSHAESLGCQRNTNACDRNVINFRNYREYTADSKIKF